MKYLIIVAVASFALVHLSSCAKDPTDEVWCNYTATGHETIEQAVPISTFRTSGLDFVRPSWCIAHCHDRKSIKAAMNFAPSSKNAKAPQYTVRSHRMPSDLKRKVEYTQTGGRPAGRGAILDVGDDVFCVDPIVASTVDMVFATYDDIETITEALNYYINKPGWAYLVYLMGPPPSIITTENVYFDPDFCMKTIYKKNAAGVYEEYQLFSGLVQD